MFKKIMNILFDEEEILVDEPVEQADEAFEIPTIKPLKERREEMKQEEVLVSAPIAKPTPTLTQEPEPVKVEPKVVTQQEPKPKSMMINADGPKASSEGDVPLHFPKKDSNTPYQPMDIISPIFGGPEKPSQPIPVVAKEVVKRRKPITEVISPMYGRVETSGSLGDIEPEILELDVVDMHSHTGSGVEIQASLYDMIEGLEDEE